MTNRLLLKRSSTANSVPTNSQLDYGELAINYRDGNLFFKDWFGAVQTIASTQFVSVAGNITGANLNLSGSISTSGNISYVDFYTGNKIFAQGLDVASYAYVGNAPSNIQGFVSVNGNVTANYFIGNGSQLTGIAASSANANALVGNTLSGNVLNSSLQTVGVLTSLSVSGNVNVSSAISATGNVTGNYFIGDGGLLTNVAGASGNKIQDGNSYAWVTSANGNIDIQVTGVANTAQFSPGAFYVSGPIATAKVINHLSLVAEDVNAVMVSPVTISASGNIFVPTSSTLTIFTPA